jgi:predicted  nucleic acid-binding Zn-ribbon protein
VNDHGNKFNQHDPLILVLELLLTLHRKVDKIMATEQELQADLDAIKAAVDALPARFATLNQTIVDLQAQIAAGTPVSQDQLDALKAEADAILASLGTL